MNEIVQKLRKYELRIRKAITAQMQGDFHSVFKGAGLEYADVRAYQYGDDVRSIDWNVSAKGHGTFIKTYREEKEQSVFLLLDVSASQLIGPAGRQKMDVGKEICGVMALSAVMQGSQVGMICFSDVREYYMTPNTGLQHAYSLIKKLFSLTPQSIKTNLEAGITLALGIIRKRSIIILISDFIDEGYERKLQTLARRHDLVIIQLYDKRESTLPGLGIIPVYDQETRQTLWINTSSPDFQLKYTGRYQRSRSQLEQLSRKFEANYVALDTTEDYVPQLIELFKLRKRSSSKS
jgi:uncharacterized protein (DUF58 family)